MRRIVILAVAVALSFSCTPDVTMHPDAFLKRGSILVQKGQYEKAVEQYSAVIDRYCEHSEAYALRAAALAELGRTDEAVGDLVHSLRNGVDERNASVLKAMALTCSEEIEGALKNECTVCQTSGLMSAIGLSAETAGRPKDALNAYKVAAGIDGTCAADAERLASAEGETGASDGEYFTRLQPDGTPYTNLRILDPYMGGEVPAAAAGRTVPTYGGNAPSVQSSQRVSLMRGEYPPLAKALGIEGTVTVRVSVSPTGTVRSVRLVAPVHFTLDSETVRLAYDYDWSSVCEGKSMTYVLPVEWKLN